MDVLIYIILFDSKMLVAYNTIMITPMTALLRLTSKWAEEVLKKVNDVHQNNIIAQLRMYVQHTRPGQAFMINRLRGISSSVDHYH